MQSMSNSSTGEIRIFDVNPALDRAALAEQFSRNRRIQIRDVLTDESARNLHGILARETPWGLAWHAAEDGPHNIRREDLATLSQDERVAIARKLDTAMRGTDYGFTYAQYPMLDAYLKKWSPGSPQDAVLELINDQPFLDLIREVSGIAELVKADAQATLYGPGHFLAQHDDSHVAEGWRLAYVLNLCNTDWRPEWGGYLNFYREDGDIEQGFRPRFNALNLFAVPQRHAVSYVPPFAPPERLAITGWFRDR
ncbi:proline hydroxylase [Novosphingobium marinum]|nr:proline hydroxylase [Novosphingobium marinum]